MINLGGIAQTAASAANSYAPYAIQQQQRAREQAQAAQAMRAWLASQQQPQAPGGIQAVPQGGQPPVTPTGNPTPLPQGGMNSPQGGPVPLSGGGAPAMPPQPQQSPVAGLPGSQPAGAGAGQQQYIPTMAELTRAVTSSGGSDADQWEALMKIMPLHAAQMQAQMEAQKDARDTQYKQDMMKYDMMKEGTAEKTEAERERHDRWEEEHPKKEALVVGQNSVTQAYLDHAADPDNKDLENKWHTLRNAFNSSKTGAGAVEGGDVSLSPGAIDEYADQLEKTGKLPTGLGYGKNSDKTAISNRHAEKYPDSKLADSSIDYIGKTSEKRAEGTRSGAIKISSAAVDGAAKMAIESSNKFNRTRFPLFNQIEQAVSKGTGGKEIIDFNAKNNTLINEYAAAQNPRGVPRIEDKKYARDLLETAYNKGQYETGVNAIVAETKNIKGATEGVMSGKETEAPVTPETPAAADAPDYSHLWSK